MSPGMGGVYSQIRNLSKAFYFALSLFGIACSAPSSNGTSFNELKIQQSIDQVNLALSQDDCSSAVASIAPIFESSSTRDDVRLATAHAYACYTGFKLFTFISDLTSFTGNLAGGGFWEFLVQAFPSTLTPGDQVYESSQSSMRALLAVVNTGTPTLGEGWVNLNTPNPGSLILNQRKDSSNTFLPFMAMASLGSLLSRYGVPDSSSRQTQVLPWDNPTQTQGNGCAFASSALLFLDSLSYLQSYSSSAAGEAYGQIQSYLSTALDGACAVGCVSCGGSVSCSSCPFLLRDQSQCAGTVTDVYSCAAAGIGALVNFDWQGP